MSLAKKLLIKPGMRVLALNASEHYRRLLEPLPDDVEVSDSPADGAYDVVHTFVTGRDELEHLAPVALRSAKPDAVIWFSYPKRASKVPTDISRDSGWETLTEAGWRPVTQVSVDDVWSALRWRPS